jgi:hypothetical protein
LIPSDLFSKLSVLIPVKVQVVFLLIPVRVLFE